MTRPTSRKRLVALLAPLLVTSSTLLVPSPATAASAVGPGTYEESSSSITYSGTWKTQRSEGSSGGAIRYGTTSAASASLTFTGSSITWYSWHSNSAGKVNVYIDGAYETTIDNYAADSETKVRAYSAQDLTAGTHTIKIQATGNANPRSNATITHLDSFVVGKPAGAAAPAVPARASDCPAPTARVSTSSGLTKALARAGAGTVIQLAPGTYRGGFVLNRSGTAGAPIWVCGPRSAIVQDKGANSQTAFRINGADHIRLAGFTVNEALQGVMVKYSSDVSIADLNVKDVGYEAIHLYAFTTDSQVIGNVIERTGAVNASFGEGIYIGTSQRRWGEVTSGRPDASDRNLIAANTIVTAGAEPIEAKEGTTGGVIRDNVITGHRAASHAVAWILVTGDRWKVADNTGSEAVQHGYASMVWSSWGQGNDFRRNTGKVDGPGYVMWNQDVGSGSTVACDNIGTGAHSGLTNVFCSP